MSDKGQPINDQSEDADDLEEPFISDDEPPRTVADFVRDSQPTSNDVVQPMTKGSEGSAVSGGGWTSRATE